MNSMTLDQLKGKTIEEILALVIEAVKDQLSVPPETEITGATTPKNDLGADSLSLVELVMRFEETFGNNELEIPDEDTIGLNTIKDYAEYLHGRINPK